MLTILIGRNENKTSTGFDWLTDYQENFDQSQKSLELKVIPINSLKMNIFYLMHSFIKEYLDKQVKQESQYQSMKNKAKLQKRQKVKTQKSY